MIQPVVAGDALYNEIDSTQPAPGEIALWWLGQSGYAIRTASMLWYVDLYLSEHLTTKYAATEKPHIRMTEAPLRGADIRHAHWVFASHKHSDHLDPGTLPALFEASPDAQLILPAAETAHAVALGLPRERLIPTRGDESFRVGAMTVHSVPSAHPELTHDEAHGYAFLGYVFEVDGVRIYHSGDTLVYPGLAERLKAFDLDLAFLPINGSSPRLKALHVPPNMNAAEAVALAQAANIRMVIPHHYDMFTFNTVDVAGFRDLATAHGVPHQILRCGERFLWRAEQNHSQVNNGMG